MPSTHRIAEILRDFVEVHRQIRELGRKHRASELRFPDVDALIRDDEGSMLYRLKERSHAVFRDPARGRGPTHRETLFDLAIGSLFHEAMKLREDLYQREAYGPRVEALRAEVREESKALFDEFERMLHGVDSRLDEEMRELEALSQQTADQLRLLIAHPPDGGSTRFVTEHATEIPEVFGVTLHELLEEMYGSVADGLVRAARSYLADGSYAAARDRFDQALGLTGPNPSLEALRAFARGIEMYLTRDYVGALRELDAWAGATPLDPALVPLARDVASSVVQLAEGADADQVARQGAALSKRLRAADDETGSR